MVPNQVLGEETEYVWLEEVRDEEYDNLKNYTQKEKNELNSYFIEEFYRNIQIIDYKIDTSKHFE